MTTVPSTAAGSGAAGSGVAAGAAGSGAAGAAGAAGSAAGAVTAACDPAHHFYSGGLAGKPGVSECRRCACSLSVATAGLLETTAQIEHEAGGQLAAGATTSLEQCAGLATLQLALAGVDVKPIQAFLDACAEVGDAAAYAGAVDRAELCAEKKRLEESGAGASEYPLVDLSGVDCEGPDGTYQQPAPWATLGECGAELQADENPAVARLGGLAPVAGASAAADVAVDPRAILTDQMEVGRDDLLAMLGVIGGALTGDLNGLSPEQEADVIEAVSLAEEFLGAAQGAKSAEKDSVMCQGMARPETCSQFSGMGRACPVSCERAQTACEKATWAVCRDSSWVKEACPRTCAAWEDVHQEWQETRGDAHSKAVSGAGTAGALGLSFGSPSFPTADDHPGCSCERDHRPVCSRKGVMFSNVCQARCQGVDVALDCSLLNPAVAFEVCAEQCDPINRPVCATKSGREFRNDCHAECAGVTVTEPCGSSPSNSGDVADERPSFITRVVNGEERRIAIDYYDPTARIRNQPSGDQAATSPEDPAAAASDVASLSDRVESGPAEPDVSPEGLSRDEVAGGSAVEGGAAADSSAGVAAASMAAVAAAAATAALILSL